jgi:hypothetical protein
MNLLEACWGSTIRANLVLANANKTMLTKKKARWNEIKPHRLRLVSCDGLMFGEKKGASSSTDSRPLVSALLELCLCQALSGEYLVCEDMMTVTDKESLL